MGGGGLEPWIPSLQAQIWWTFFTSAERVSRPIVLQALLATLASDGQTLFQSIALKAISDQQMQTLKLLLTDVFCFYDCPRLSAHRSVSLSRLLQAACLKVLLMAGAQTNSAHDCQHYGKKTQPKWLNLFTQPTGLLPSNFMRIWKTSGFPIGRACFQNL